MNFLIALAQTTAENPAFYSVGSIGIVCGWFMFRAERIGNRLITEVRKLNHNYQGMQKVQLIAEINRSPCHPIAFNEAKKMLAEIEARSGMQPDLG